MKAAEQPAPTRGEGWAGLGSELSARIVSSLALGTVALLVTWYGGWPFAVLWLAAGAAMTWEWLAMLRAQPPRALAAIATIGLGALWLAALALPPVWAAVAGIVAGAAVCLCAASGRDRLWALAGLLYGAVIVLAMPLLRDEPRYGLAIILWMFAVVWGSDTAAYFAGRRFGGPKLWPAVSPKKTWSGAVAGTAAAVAAGIGVVLAFERWAGLVPPCSLPLVALGSALASAAGQLGDLGESALKRHAGVKDSGRLIPGHGGVMDRLDALWAVALLAGGVLTGARFFTP